MEFEAQFLIDGATNVLDEAYFQAERHAVIEADKDVCAPSPPDEDARQQCLDLATRMKDGRGGKTKRPPPPVEWLTLSTLDRPSSRYEGYVPKGANDLDKVMGATDAELAQWMHYIEGHKGRRCGLTPNDYAWQGEWTLGRSLTYGFFDSRRSVERPPEISDALALKLLGDEETAYLRRFVALLCTADRMNKVGLTLSGPEIAILLGNRCSVSTAWRVIARAEEKGLTFRMRRFKPSKSKKGAPVKYSANWYGIGPTLIQCRPMYLGQAELALLSTKEKAEAETSIDSVRQERRKHRARHRTQRYNIGARRRGVQRARKPGTVMPSKVEYAQMLVEGESKRDEARTKLSEAVSARGAEYDRQAAAMCRGELSAPDTDAIDASDVAESAAAAQAVGDVGGLEALERDRPEVDEALRLLRTDEGAEPGGPKGEAPLEMDGPGESLLGPLAVAPALGSPPDSAKVGGLRGGEEAGPRYTIPSPDGTVPVKATGMKRKGSELPREPPAFADSGGSPRAGAPPPTPFPGLAAPCEGTGVPAVPVLAKPPDDGWLPLPELSGRLRRPEKSRANTGPPIPDRPPSVAAGRLPEGQGLRGGVARAAQTELRRAVEAMHGSDMAERLARILGIEGEP